MHQSAWRGLLLATPLFLLAACDTQPTATASAVAPISVPRTAAEGVVASAGSAAVAPSERALSCPAPTLTLTSSLGRFGVVECAPVADDPEGAYTFHFVHDDGSDAVEAVVDVDVDTVSATVADALEPQLWGDHVVTLDLPQERGGLLLIANWTGKAFATSQYRYDGGDEDSLSLAWHDGALLASTESGGTRRLKPDTADAAVPHAFVQDTLRCAHRTDGVLETSLQLAVDAHGAVTGVSYLAVTPAGGGGATTCGVDANDLDGETTWQITPDSAVRVGWNDGEVREDGASEAASWLAIHRDGPRYTVDLRVRHSQFCGQSSALASRIVLERGRSTCAAVAF